MKTAMDDVLKSLLQAEQRAESLVQEAEVERDATINQTKAEAHAAEEAFAARIPAIRDQFLQKAEEQATRTLKELERHYEEFKVQVQTTAQQHESEAVEAAVALLLDSARE
ncbi:MAG: hypothetical protein M0Q44_00690 [Methylobacter sp.]|jgi:vacuolar-type H+-ATPase subunit H|nr:hypothetical protein [Methylobacter sp.]